MSTFKEIAFLFNDQQINLTEYLPYSGRFTVPAWTNMTANSANSIDLTVPIIARSDDNYNVFFKQQSNVARTTEVWLTFQLMSRTTSSFVVRAYNEQRVNIEQCECGYIVVPNIIVKQ